MDLFPVDSSPYRSFLGVNHLAYDVAHLTNLRSLQDGAEHGRFAGNRTSVTGILSCHLMLNRVCEGKSNENGLVCGHVGHIYFIQEGGDDNCLIDL